MPFLDTAAHEEGRRAFPRLRGPGVVVCPGLAEPWAVGEGQGRPPLLHRAPLCFASASTLVLTPVQCQRCQGRVGGLS